MHEVDNQNQQLKDYRNRIENIANQLCVVVKGEFNFAIKIDEVDETLQKLCMLINFVLDAARRALSAEEEKNAKLMELDKLKSDFIANISHELRTPLTLIMGPLETLLADTNVLDQDSKDNLHRMQRNARRLYTLVNDVLDFSKLEAEKFAVNEELVNLNALILEMVDDAQGLAHEKKITLNYSGAHDLREIFIDKKMIEKIMMNLISNALKFTGEEGHINVQLENLGSKVRITVADTGIGIPETYLARLFKRFHQVDSSKTRAYEGTGLGLAIVHEFVKLMKGEITVQSQVEKGSQFIVTLPARTMTENQTDTPIHIKTEQNHSSKLLKNSFSIFANEQTTKQSIEESALVDKISGQLPLILIADDNDDMRSYIITLLKDDYEIIVAKNGEEAFEIAKKYRPQVILCDVMMPIMDGYQLTKKIKSDPLLQHTSLILLTARSGNASIMSALAVGADDYLCKPFSSEELKARTAAALRSYRAYMKLVATNTQLDYTKNNLADSYEELEKVHQELKETQLQLLQHSKLASIGQLAAGVAHEINNPIAFVTSNVELLKKYFLFLKDCFDYANIQFRTLPQEEKQQWEALCTQKNITSVMKTVPEVISESIVGLERVADIVSDLKSFSRSGQVEIQEANINQCIDLILKIIGTELRYKCKITKQYSELPLLQCNARQLNQVFMNILLNAGQAIKTKGDITICTQAKNDEIIVMISDSGEGINPEYLDKLFDPFFTTKPVGQGTGLGLSISYNIIKEHGGRIDVQSKIGEGTTFTIYLPLKGGIENPAVKVEKG